MPNKMFDLNVQSVDFLFDGDLFPHIVYATHAQQSVFAGPARSVGCSVRMVFMTLQL